MIGVLSRNWWALVLRGVFAVLFGIIVFLAPGIALASMVLVLAAYLLVDGIFAIISAFQNRTQQGWWIHLLEGLIGIIAGVTAFLYPVMTSFVLLYILAFWAVFTGVLEIWSAIELRKQIDNEWMMGLAGLASIIFGIVLILFPSEGLTSLLWLVGLYSVGFGILLIMLGFRLKSYHERHNTTSERVTHTA